MSDRARGALLGLAVGDALGTTLEFSRPTPRPFSALLDGPHTDITGGGPFRVAPGQVTDDTQMATCLADSIAWRGRYDLDDVARRYVEWSRVAFDIGNQTRASLSLAARGVSPRDAGREAWLRGRRDAAGNGSLMRAAPIGALFSHDVDVVRLASLDDAYLTHGDPRCGLACAAFNAAVALSVRDVPADPRALLDVARASLSPTAEALTARFPDDAAYVSSAVVVLSADLDAALRDDPDLYGDGPHLHRDAGFVRVAFRLAFWELLHAPTYRAALLDVVNRGGDADTNGAIVGALLGAFHGAGAIPSAWADRVMGALSDRPQSPFADRYHPRRLLAALG